MRQRSAVSPDSTSRDRASAVADVLQKGSLGKSTHGHRPASRKTTRSSRTLLLVWASMLTVVGIGELLPRSSKPMQVLATFDLSDAVMHFGAYAALGIIPALGLPVAMLVGCLITTEIFGILLEVGQAFVPGRSCDVQDVLSNTAGLLVGTMIALVLRPQLLARVRRRTAGRGL